MRDYAAGINIGQSARASDACRDLQGHSASAQMDVITHLCQPHHTRRKIEQPVLRRLRPHSLLVSGGDSPPLGAALEIGTEPLEHAPEITHARTRECMQRPSQRLGRWCTHAI